MKGSRQLWWALASAAAFAVGVLTPSLRPPESPADRDALPSSAHGVGVGASSESPLEMRPEVESLPASITDLFALMAMESDPRRQEVMALEFIRGLGPEACAATVAELDRMPRNRMRAYMLDRCYEKWANHNATGALTSAQGRTYGERGDMIAAVMRGWAMNAPHEAWAWIKAQEETPLHSWNNALEKYRMSVVDGMASEGRLAEAADLVSNLSARDSSFHLTETLMEAWTWNDLPSATAWALEANAGESGALALRAIATQLASRDPQSARAWMDALPENVRPAAARGIVHQWLLLDEVVGVMEWAASLPPQPEYDRVITDIMFPLTATDPEIAFRLATAQTSDASRDQALSFGARLLMNSAPEESIRWAQSIASEEARERTTKRVFQHWQRTDPDAARKYLEESDLIPEGLENELID